MQRYDGTAGGSDFPNAIARDALNNIYVSGGSAGSGTNLDIATIKYSQGQFFSLRQAPAPAEESKSEFSLKILPNPSRGNADIVFTIAEDETITLELYDLMGRKKETLQDHVPMKAGTYSVNLSPRHANPEYSGSGIYFLRFRAGMKEEIKKIVVIR